MSTAKEWRATAAAVTPALRTLLEDCGVFVSYTVLREGARTRGGLDKVGPQVVRQETTSLLSQAGRCGSSPSAPSASTSPPAGSGRRAALGS